MFLGQYTKTLDDKHRVIIPSEFRKAVEDSAAEDSAAEESAADRKGSSRKTTDYCLTITPGKGQCLSLIILSEFKKLVGKIKPEEHYNDEDLQEYARFVGGNTHKGPCDKQGRFPIPKNLRDDAGILKEVMLVGVFNHVEIWDIERWKRYSAERRSDISEVTKRVRQKQTGDDQ